MQLWRFVWMQSKLQIVDFWTVPQCFANAQAWRLPPEPKLRYTQYWPKTRQLKLVLLCGSFVAEFLPVLTTIQITIVGGCKWLFASCKRQVIGNNMATHHIVHFFSFVSGIPEDLSATARCTRAATNVEVIVAVQHFQRHLHPGVYHCIICRVCWLSAACCFISLISSPLRSKSWDSWDSWNEPNEANEPAKLLDTFPPVRAVQQLVSQRPFCGLKTCIQVASRPSGQLQPVPVQLTHPLNFRSLSSLQAIFEFWFTFPFHHFFRTRFFDVQLHALHTKLPPSRTLRRVVCSPDKSSSRLSKCTFQWSLKMVCALVTFRCTRNTILTNLLMSETRKSSSATVKGQAAEWQSILLLGFRSGMTAMKAMKLLSFDYRSLGTV